MRTLNGWQKSKGERIDLGIAIAHATTMPGQTRTLQEIADYCDCSREAIRHIEEAALKKCRFQMQAYLE